MRESHRSTDSVAIGVERDEKTTGALPFSLPRKKNIKDMAEPRELGKGSLGNCSVEEGESTSGLCVVDDRRQERDCTLSVSALHNTLKGQDKHTRLAYPALIADPQGECSTSQRVHVQPPPA